MPRLIFPIVAILLAASFARAEDYHGPWDVKSLQKPPKVTWADDPGPLRKLYYESEPLSGKPTRIFAYLARPEKVEGKLPAMVLVHGGGGTAFREWAELWAKRGYVAIAMDLAGNGPDRKRLPDGIPDQSDATKFPLEPKPLKEMWSYHAVAAVIKAVSLLTTLPEVDAQKIGVTGISWGGYLTCIVMGLDDRLKVAVPVYGCGFLHENSIWLPLFEKMKPDWRKQWVENFDPSKYVAQAKMPVLFVNGTNDFAYPLDSYQKTYRLVKDRTLCIKVNMPHGHKEGWAPVEIGLFADRHLKMEGRLPQIDRMIDFSHGAEDVAVRTGTDTTRLIWTEDLNLPWQKRKWQTREPYSALQTGGIYFALFSIPKMRPIMCFANSTDKRGATVSTAISTLEK